MKIDSMPTAFARLSQTTIGLHTPYPVLNVDGQVLSEAPQIYLDSAASTKMIQPVFQALLDEGLLDYANTHARAYLGARITTDRYQEAHEIMLRFCQADPSTHTAIFVGSGATGAINRLARSLFKASGTNKGSSRNVVLFSAMEHHANQLPWMKYAERAEAIPIDPTRGDLDVNHLAGQLRQFEGRVRLVSVTGISNVTGILNPLPAIAHLAHQFGAEILVDAAQMAAHHPIAMQDMGVDYLVLSGHKTYAPLSPGVLIAPKASMLQNDPDELGGGIVRYVDLEDFVLTEQLPDREEAGTPNILGAIILAQSLETLRKIGMEHVWGHELSLTHAFMKGLIAITNVTVYGHTDLERTPRAGVISFNVEGLHRSVVARALSDYFNIAVRAGRFCAQPYVLSLLNLNEEETERAKSKIRNRQENEAPGMVRASLGIYSTMEDVQNFLRAVGWISTNVERLRGEYEILPDGTVRRYDGWDAKENLAKERSTAPDQAGIIS